MQARFPAGTFARIAARLEDDEDRTDFVRKAVERELAGRYVHPAYFDHAPRMHPGGMIDWAAGERPVIGLTGERMLNRQETAVYNRGGGRGASHSVSFGDTNIVINGNADDKAIAQIKRELAGHRTAIAQQQKVMMSAQHYQSTGVSR